MPPGEAERRPGARDALGSFCHVGRRICFNAIFWPRRGRAIPVRVDVRTENLCGGTIVWTSARVLFTHRGDTECGALAAVPPRRIPVHPRPALHAAPAALRPLLSHSQVFAAPR